MGVMAEKALSKSEAGKLQRAKDAALARIRRLREREEQIRNGAIGIGAGYFGAKWWAGRRAKVARGELERPGFKLGSLEIDGRVAGGLLAASGMLGLLGDDELYNQGAYAAGVAVLSADAAITEYEDRLAEPPSE